MRSQCDKTYCAVAALSLGKRFFNSFSLNLPKCLIVVISLMIILDIPKSVKTNYSGDLHTGGSGVGRAVHL